MAASPSSLAAPDHNDDPDFWPISLSCSPRERHDFEPALAAPPLDDSVSFSFSTHHHNHPYHADFPQPRHLRQLPDHCWSSDLTKSCDFASKASACFIRDRGELEVYPADSLFRNGQLLPLLPDADQGAPTSTSSLPATDSLIKPQSPVVKRSCSIDSQSSGVWSSSEKCSRKSSACSSRSSSGYSDDCYFSRKGSHKLGGESRSSSRNSESPLYCKNSRDYNLNESQKQPRERPSHTRRRLASANVKQLQPVQAEAHDQAKQNHNIVQSVPPSPRSPLNWRVLSLQPLNPSHARSDEWGLGARKLQLSLSEKSRSSQASPEVRRARKNFSAKSSPASPYHIKEEERRVVLATELANDQRGQSTSQKLSAIRSDSWSRPMKDVKPLSWLRQCRLDCKKDVANSAHVMQKLKYWPNG